MESIILLPILTGAVVLYLFKTKRITRVVCLILLVGTAAAGGKIFLEYQEGSRQEITELSREEDGKAEEGVPLTVEADNGESSEVQIRVTDPEPSEKEMNEKLEKEAALLEEKILGKNSSLSHVEWNLELPFETDDPSVSIFWMSSRPDVLTSDGMITSEAEAKGTDVVLTAQLTTGEQTTEFRRNLTVFPSKEENAAADRFQKAADKLNKNRNESNYLLPEELDGKKLTWYRNAE
ncbi:MAG: hypothetical protein HUJ73_00595, partial [Eubacterium sp.]|nr:hypothetical protein [Eubacterium sp.]